MYDEKELNARLSKKRKSFIIAVSTQISILAVGITFIILSYTDTLFFAGILYLLIKSLWLPSPFKYAITTFFLNSKLYFAIKNRPPNC